MTAAMWVTIVPGVFLFVVLLAWVLTRHRHNWGPWEDYEVTQGNGHKHYTQVRQCRDRTCQRKYTKRLTI